MKWIAIALMTALVIGCTTAPKTESTTGREKLPGMTTPDSGAGSSIDYVGLQRAMGMEIPFENLGYKEKSFNTCQAGYGYSTTHNCVQNYMVVINFRLQCRDSVGTVSEGVTNADLTAIANRPVRWTLKPSQGLTNTDSEGYGQIMTVVPRSAKRERLKIAVGNDFLYMRANEITRVVTPRPWCN